MILYADFLIEVLDHAAASVWWRHGGDTQKIEGALAGLEACRGQTPAELQALLEYSRAAARAAQRRLGGARAAYYACFEAEVELAAGAVSAALALEGLPTLIDLHAGRELATLILEREEVQT